MLVLYTFVFNNNNTRTCIIFSTYTHTVRYSCFTGICLNLYGRDKCFYIYSVLKTIIICCGCTTLFYTKLCRLPSSYSFSSTIAH